MNAPEATAPALPIIITEERGSLYVSCNAGRVKIERAPLYFKGRDVLKDEWNDGDRKRVAYFRADLRLSEYLEGKEVSYATVNGVPLLGCVSSLYAKHWVARDENGDAVQALRWGTYYDATSVRRVGGFSSDSLPDGVRAVVNLLAEIVPAQAATPARLTKAEVRRLRDLATREAAQAKTRRQEAAEHEKRAGKLNELATAARDDSPTPRPCTEAEHAATPR